MIDSISFVGAGNVTTHFAKAFYKAGISIDCIINRRLAPAKKIAHQVNAKATSSYRKLPIDSSLYIVAVPDDAINEVAQSLAKVLNKKKRFVVHSSGATPQNILAKHFDNYGIIWPPQSLSKHKDILFREVPMCYSANSKSNTMELQQMLTGICEHIQEVSETQKLAFHLAAVFANNFTNHMYAIAHEICARHALDLSMLYPIIQETAQKILEGDPHTMQTGPAIRRDDSSMNRHVKLLSSDPQYKKLYILLSKSIQNYKPIQ